MPYRSPSLALCPQGAWQGPRLRGGQQCLSRGWGPQGGGSQGRGGWLGATRPWSLSPQAGWTFPAAAAAPWPGTSLGLCGRGAPPLRRSRGLTRFRPRVPAAARCSAAWPSCGRPGRGGGGRSRSTACTTTASAAATAASAAPTSTTPRRWPCAPGDRRGVLGGRAWGLASAAPHALLAVCAGSSGARARRRTGPAPSPTTSPRRR